MVGIVSKLVSKPVDRLTLFQDNSRCQVARKRHNNKYLEPFDGIKQNVKSVNLRLGSVRRSPMVKHCVREHRSPFWWAESPDNGHWAKLPANPF